MSHTVDLPTVSRRLWKVTGTLVLAHVVLMLGGFTLQRVARFGDSPGTAVSIYRDSPLGAAGIGQAVSLLGFVAFLVVVPLIARLLRGSTDATRWLGSVIASSGAVYVAITLGVAFAASDAARYAADNGTPGTTVAALSNLHWLAVFMATVILGVFTVAVSVAVWMSNLLPRWVVVLGFLAGAGCLTAAVNPPESIVDDATLLWMVWFLALGVTALRSRRAPSSLTAVSVAI